MKIFKNSLENLIFPSAFPKRSLFTVPKTIERFPGKFQRGNFKIPNLNDLESLVKIVGSNHVRSNLVDSSVELDKYNVDHWRQYRGCSQIVVFPRTPNQVAQVLKYCNEQHLAVVPQGGNTSVVGGSVPIFDEIVLSTEKLDKIISIDATSGIVVSEAGVILEKLDDACAEKGLIVPLDLGAKGSCHIGGNVATNAGGLRYVRYGSLRGTVLGLQVALTNGTLLDVGLSSPLRKDNTGYDLKQLFIGSEGSLGIITAVALQSSPRPKSRNVAIAAVSSYQAVQEAFVQAKTHLNEILSAFEFWDRQSVELVERVLGQTLPVPSSPFYVLVETSGSLEEHDMEKLNDYLQHLMTTDVAQDGIIAQDESQALKMWSFRENIPVAWGKDGKHCLCYDLDLPLSKLYDVVNQLRERFKLAGEPYNHLVGFGHVGDFNLHLNLAMPEFSQRGLDLVEPFIYEYTRQHRGSISAEHGLGVMKKPYLSYTKDDVEVGLMKRVKKLFDPMGILNPGKMF